MLVRSLTSFLKDSTTHIHYKETNKTNKHTWHTCFSQFYWTLLETPASYSLPWHQITRPVPPKQKNDIMTKQSSKILKIILLTDIINILSSLEREGGKGKVFDVLYFIDFDQKGYDTFWYWEVYLPHHTFYNSLSLPPLHLRIMQTEYKDKKQ